MKINKLTLRAEEQTVSNIPQSADSIMTLEQSFKVSGATRALADKHVIKLRENSVIELVYDDNTVWFCSPDTLSEIYPDLEVQRRSDDDEYELPTVLQGEGQQRGVASDIALKIVNIFAKKKIKEVIGGKVRDLAADLEKKQLEQRSGLYRVTSGFKLEEFKSMATQQPYLLFLHGTGSSTLGSFQELTENKDWSSIEQLYGANILAFEHESLTKSPLQNVAELVQALPDNCTLHLITHSRGGLVGDILSRFCISDDNNRGFTKDEYNLLSKTDRKQADAIRNTLKQKKIQVTRFIRVACPAQGTTLASKRLDTYLNVIFNLIGYSTGVSANPVYVAFKNLVVAVLDCKNDSDLLPGLEAMNPDSPFIKALNHPKSPIVASDSLLVVAGNSQVNLSVMGVVVIISKLFYLHKNDLVVDTDSMYYGTTRSREVQYFFDEGPGVDHFNYFKKQNKTSDTILRSLKVDDITSLEGVKSRSLILEEATRNAIFKADGGQVFKNTVTGTRPIAVILPGIMGSSLTQDDQALWIDYARFLTGGLGKLDISNKKIAANALIRTSYEQLASFLEDKYDVVTFPYDWRLSLLASADIFNDKIQQLLEYKQPIKIVAHSMGGVLVRDFIIRHDDTWQALNNSKGFKLVFLGAPLRGSFRIPAVLFGEDPLIDKLAKIDLTRDKAALLSIFSKFPGLLGLLPIANNFGTDFLRAETWQTLREAHGDSQWPLPPTTVLSSMTAHRDKIEDMLESPHAIDYTNISYIAGKDKATAAGYRIDKLKDGTQELVFLYTEEGDQSVTWETGIPRKLIDKNAVYYVDVTHGALANDRSIFNGIADILSNGQTTLLSRTRPAVRSTAKLTRGQKTVDFDLSERGVTNTVLGLPSQPSSKARLKTPLKVSVVRGDLRFAAYPVLAGHFNEDGILYAEKTIDRYLNNALSQRHQLGLYPGPIGTNEVVLSDDGNFKGALVVGLGISSELTAYELTRTVEQGIAKYLLLLNDLSGNGTRQSKHASTGISSLIIGCGYGGLSVESAVRAILQGISNANDKITLLYGEFSRLMESVEFIEQYDDQSLACLYAINKLQGDPTLRVSVLQNKVIGKLGGRERMPIDMSTDWWTRITVQPTTRLQNNKTIRTLQFNVSTGGAQEKQRDVHTSREIIDQLIDDISTQNHWTPALAKTLFELLIPNDFKDQIKKRGNITWVVDEYMAAIPWELLHDTTDGQLPLSVNASVIRQMIRTDGRNQVKTVRDAFALVIGDPDLNGFVTQLPGALREAQQIDQLLRQNDYGVTAKFRASPPDIIQALFSSDYKVIHLAGHGIFNEDPEKPSGMVIGKNVFLSSREIAQMSSTPELVFVNCCFLGQTDGGAEEYFRNRYKLAANLGTQLIVNGVKAVVVAGWAVDDAAALEFAKCFYSSLFAGESFGDAVKIARRWTYDRYPKNNTWGAYQCYGDPFYRLTTHTKKKNRTYSFAIPQQAEIELFNLRSEIQMNSIDTATALTRLIAIGKAVDSADLRTSTITELEAMIHVELYDYDGAIRKFESLLNMENATFSVAAMEKYCNIRVKKYVVDLAALKNDPNKNPGQKSSGQRRIASKIKEVVDDLNGLLKLGKTAERLSLLGSTYKRLAIVSENPTEKTDALMEAALYYQQAYAFKGNDHKVYSFTNWITLENLVVLLKKRKWDSTVSYKRKSYHLYSEKELMDELERLKTTMPSPDSMDYWQLLSSANLLFTKFLLERVFHPTGKRHAVSRDVIIAAYRGAWKRASSQASRMAEMEHLDFLIDGYSLSNTAAAKAVRKEIEGLKTELAKELQDGGTEL